MPQELRDCALLAAKLFCLFSAACRNYHEALEATRRLHERSSSRLRTALNPHSVYTTDLKSLRPAAADLLLNLICPCTFTWPKQPTNARFANKEQACARLHIAKAQFSTFRPQSPTGVHLNKDEIAILADKKCLRGAQSLIKHEIGFRHRASAGHACCRP